MTESLKETVVRVEDYWEREIKPQIIQGKQVIIAAHGNSLRALIKYLERLSKDQIVDVNIPTGTPLVYTLDEQFKPIVITSYSIHYTKLYDSGLAVLVGFTAIGFSKFVLYRSAVAVAIGIAVMLLA